VLGFSMLVGGPCDPDKKVELVGTDGTGVHLYRPPAAVR
jgi:hypothetical protein